MGAAGLFDINKQLTFYGAYHSHPTNVLIHMICVPAILGTAEVFMAALPQLPFLPSFQYKVNDYMMFETNNAALYTAVFMAYYFILEPVAALLYVPIAGLLLLTATAVAQMPGGVSQAAMVHGAGWILQFVGHGVAEKRAPALLDNLVQALLLAPFFVHLEYLFQFGYRPALQKQLEGDVAKELARIKKEEAQAGKAAA